MSELSKSEDQRITKTKDEQIKQIDISISNRIRISPEKLSMKII